MPSRPDTLSAAEARRLAIKAQAAHGERTATTATRSELRRLIHRLGVVQIDSVNVLARAHTLPAFSRLGAYNVADLHNLAYGGRRRQLFEYWGHAASQLPVKMQPLFRWRMHDAADGTNIYTGLRRFGIEKKKFIQQVLREIEQRGPSVAADFEAHGNRTGGWWGWSDAKTALEWLFWAGDITTESRGPQFERYYDVTERVLPSAVVKTPTPKPDDAKRSLIETSARALGVGTEKCLRDYYRLDPTSCRTAILELVEAGTLREVTVDGWRNPAYVHAKTRVPRAVHACALLAPFDPLIWHRDRAEALFDARIRIEIYTPKHKRQYGYYVLPFLFGNRIVARVDLKANREQDSLNVLAAHGERGVDPASYLTHLAGELILLRHWLGLVTCNVARRGDIAVALGKAITKQS